MTAKKKRICMITSFFYPRWGGAELQLLTLAKALHRRDFAVTVITRRYDAPGQATDQKDGITVKRLFAGGGGRISSFLFMCSLCLYLLKHNNRYDIIQSNLASSHALAGSLFGRLFRKKIVIKFGGGGLYGDIATSQKSILGRTKLFLLKMLRPRCVAVSEQIRRELLEAGFNGRDISVIPNGIDRSVFRPAADKDKLRKEHKLPEGILYIFSGRFSEVKNLDLLVRAWKCAAVQMPDAHLIMLGDGEKKESINKLIDELEIKNRVRITGFVENIAPFYQACDIFLLPSRSEGMSNALLEAVACGLFPVANRVGDIERFIHDGKDGILLNNCTVEELTDAMIQSRRLYAGISSEIQNTAIRRYDIGSIAEAYAALYA